MDPRSRTSFRGGLAAALALALVAGSCGGGGGGGPADQVSLAGTLTVPSFSSSLGEGAPRDGSVYDDDAFHARRLGAVDHARAAVKAVSPENFNQEIDFFGNKVTLRQVIMILGNHAEEHLGQMIAYARSNGVVPPWSQKQE